MQLMKWLIQVCLDRDMKQKNLMVESRICLEYQIVIITNIIELLFSSLTCQVSSEPMFGKPNCVSSIHISCQQCHLNGAPLIIIFIFFQIWCEIYPSYWIFPHSLFSNSEIWTINIQQHANYEGDKTTKDLEYMTIYRFPDIDQHLKSNEISSCQAFIDYFISRT